MDMYAKLKELEKRVEAGEESLLTIREQMRKWGADRLSDVQLAAAIKPEPAVDEPEAEIHTPAAPEKRGPGRPRRNG
jgi:hypothetical protein